ncbi:c-type cytochrome [Pacificispira sp.]|uniref:c-type cytochrome n=1 Tax=Pacificispira sp. TaxID=2888761 RepID=UPI003BA917E8
MTKIGLRPAAFIVGVGLLAAGGYLWWQQDKASMDADAGLSIPEFSEVAVAGQQIFNKNCSACHGSSANGSENGPPLIHKIYEPGHHSDEAFYRAVAMGSRQHHWRFGDMPAQPQVSPPEVTRIIAYIRELQVANGIGH